MTEEELNHLYCLKAENALLIKHNKDIIQEKESISKALYSLKKKHFELQKEKNPEQKISTVPQFVKGELNEYRKNHYVEQLLKNNENLKKKNKDLLEIRNKYIELLNKNN